MREMSLLPAPSMIPAEAVQMIMVGPTLTTVYRLFFCNPPLDGARLHNFF